MARDGREPVIMEDVKIVLRNFEGREGPFNRAGDRGFAILLSDVQAEAMEADGWNVKTFKSREIGEPEQPFLRISVSFKGRPPNIFMITHKGKTKLTEKECELLDWVDIETADIIFNPHSWEVNGRGGVKAYLNSLYVTIRENPLELKYSDIETADDTLPARAGRVDED